MDEPNPGTELANVEQVRLLISLYTQLSMPYDPVEISRLTKWQASARISTLRGRPTPSAEALDAALLTVLQARLTSGLPLSDDDPTPPQSDDPEPPATRRRR